MNVTDQNIAELIESYLEGRMSLEQKTKFEKAIAQNEIWKNNLEQEILVQKSIRSYGQYLIKNKIKQDISSGKAYRYKRWKYFLGGVAVVLVTSVGVYYSGVFKKTIKKEKSKLARVKDERPHVESTNHTPSQKVNTSEETSYHTNKVVNPIIKEDVEGRRDVINDTLMNNEKSIEDEAISTEVPVSTLSLKSNIDKEVSAKDKVNDKICDDVFISFETSESKSCIDKKEGNIIVYQLKGGESPYTKTLYQNGQKTESFYDLSPGQYLIKVVDANQCEKKKEVTIIGKPCIEERKFLFNRQFQSELDIQLDSKNGVFILKNERMEKVYEKEFDGFDEGITFDGQGLNGDLPSGVYYLSVQYDDQTEEKGYLTIQ